MATKSSEEIYCPHCGKIISRHAEICPKCGVRVKMAPPIFEWPDGRKEKLIAILLAVFFGFWTWLYTIRVDMNKFILNFVLSVITCGIWYCVSWVWAVIDTTTRPDSFYENF